MGKKFQKKLSQEAQDEEVDPELQAEINAVNAMRAEKFPSSENDEETPKAKNTYNKDGLFQSLEAVGTESLPFVQSMQVCDFELDVPDDNNDLERELAFYNHALLAVKSARNLLESANIPTRRPTDYFCEHVKTDSHMTKIKDNLILEEKKIAALELRKQRELNRTFNKQVSTLRKEEKSKNTKEQIESVNKLRKKRAFSATDKEDNDESFNKLLDDQEPRQKSLKRMRMDKKYGHGGKDGKTRKLNDRKSINDMSAFSPKGGKFVNRGGGAGGRGGGGSSGGRGGGGGGRGGGGGGRGGGGGGRGGGGGGRGGGGGGKSNRPGKDSRSKMRSQRSQSA
eukprot:gene10172-21204_t